jgi:hypothetical protein
MCLLGFATTLLAGCANQMHGTWVATGETPKDSPCVMKSMSFNDDGTFVADALVEGKPTTMKGTWKYEMMKLKLDMGANRQREYNACVWWGNTLKMDAAHGGKSYSQSFSHQAQPPKGQPTETIKKA